MPRKKRLLSTSCEQGMCDILHDSEAFLALRYVKICRRIAVEIASRLKCQALIPDVCISVRTEMHV